jgi:putative endonuclease
VTVAPEVTMRRKDALGIYGEHVAAQYLERQGMVIVERNWRCEIGEIDIIAREAGTLVICEVKTRSSAGHGSPLEAISDRKVRRLRRLALRWLEAKCVHAPFLRFDAVGVTQSRTGHPEIRHVRGFE